MYFGRTNLRISLSGAKFEEEADIDVHTAVGPPKPHQIDKNLTFRSKKFADFFFSPVAREGQQLEDWVKLEASHRCPHMFVTCRRSQCFLAFFTDVDAPQLAGRVRFGLESA